jgi:hypothetical protein
MSRASGRAAAIIISALLAGCQPAPSTAPANSDGAVPTDAAVVSPSPGIDVVPLFAAAIKAMSSGVVAIDGTAVVGPVQVTIAGTSTFDGPDSKGEITTTVAGVSSVVETVKVAGSAYSKTGDGPWLAVTTPSGDSDFNTALKNSAASSFTDNGTQTRDGQVVHELVASDSSSFDPKAFLGSATGVTNVGGTTTFYCAEDGTPVGATIEVTWTQAAGTQTLNGSMTMEMKFSALGTAQTIRAPDVVWKPFTSTRWAFSLAYPPDYDHDSDKNYDYFIGPGTTFMTASRAKNLGYTLNVIAKGEATQLKRLLGAKTVSNTAITVSGLTGRLLSGTGTNKDLGGKVVVHEAIVVKGKFVYYVAWFSAVGNEAADLATFMQTVATFKIS